MATNKTRLQAKAGKDRRKKMIAIGGALLLLVLVVIQGPRTLKMLRSNSSAQPVMAPGSAPATSAAQPALPTPALTTGKLPDRNAAPAPEDGQLASFELFESKDPFAQQVTEVTAAEAATAATGQATQSATTSQSAGSSSTPTETQPERSLASVVIAVNGSQETVQVAQSFPADNPTFTLVSAGSASAKIGIAGGRLAEGGRTVTLKVGKRLTLVNTVDGTRYVLALRSTQ